MESLVKLDPNEYEQEVINIRTKYFTAHYYEARRDLVRKYAWAIPNQSIIESIVKFAGDSTIVEVGAGSGYWARLISDFGGNIDCFDNHDLGFGFHNEYYPVSNEDHTVISSHKVDEKNKVLLLIWPPYATNMAEDCVRNALSSGYDKVIYIGESYGGCTANDGFFDLIYETADLIDELLITTYEGIYDRVYFYKLK